MTSVGSDASISFGHGKAWSHRSAWEHFLTCSNQLENPRTKWMLSLGISSINGMLSTFFGIPGGGFFISIECREIFSHVRFVLSQSVNDSDDLVIRCFPETVYAAPWFDALMEKK